MSRPARPFLATALACLTQGFGAANKTSDDPLGKFTRCRWPDGITVAGTARRAPGQGWRILDKDTNMRISVADSHRLLLRNRRAAPWVNLQIDQSVPATFAQDRATLRAWMAHHVAQTPTGARTLSVTRGAGVDVLVLDQHDIERSGVTGMAVVIATISATIVTAYFLYQPPHRRTFASLPDYLAARDDVIAALRHCLSPSHTRATQNGSASLSDMTS